MPPDCWVLYNRILVVKTLQSWIKVYIYISLDGWNAHKVHTCSALSHMQTTGVVSCVVVAFLLHLNLGTFQKTILLLVLFYEHVIFLQHNTTLDGR